MALKEVRHLKKTIRSSIKNINDNKLKDVADIESLQRWSAWLNRDCVRLLEEWNKKDKSVTGGK